MSGALDGIRILELSRYIAAPVAGKILGEMGADIIKVEDPVRGDPMRHWQSGDRSHSPQFAIYNRTKRGIAVDLKHESGRDLLLRLADEADVLIENFRPGVMDRLGLGYDVLTERNPRLVYASITGYGSEGPYVDRPAYDTVISAQSGLFSQIIDVERPQPVGPAFSDILAGMAAAHGVMAALIARQRTGRGQYVDVPMLRTVLSLLAEPASVFADLGVVTEPTTRQRRAQSYGLVSSDGVPFVVHLSVPEKFWIAMTEVMELVELQDDPRFVDRQARHDNYRELDALFKEQATRRTIDDWFSRLEAADLPHGRINTLASVFDDAQVASMDLIEEIDLGPDERPLRQMAPGLVLSDTPARATPPAPTLGADTDAVLAELGLTEAEIDSLRREGVIA